MSEAEKVRDACARLCESFKEHLWSGAAAPGTHAGSVATLLAGAIRRILLPVPATAVEEARDAERFRWLMSRNFGFAFDAEKCGISTGRWGKWPEEPDKQRAMIDRAIAYYAAKGGNCG